MGDLVAEGPSEQQRGEPLTHNTVQSATETGWGKKTVSAVADLWLGQKTERFTAAETKAGSSESGNGKPVQT